MSAWATLRQFVDRFPDEPSEVVAKRALAELDADAIVGLLTREIDHLRRMNVLDLERAIQIAPRATTSDTGHRRRVERDDLAAPFRSLFGCPMALGDGKKVRFEEATVEQHRQRITMLTAMRSGIDRTIDLHRAAIDAITRARVTRISELV